MTTSNGIGQMLTTYIRCKEKRETKTAPVIMMCGGGEG